MENKTNTVPIKYPIEVQENQALQFTVDGKVYLTGQIGTRRTFHSEEEIKAFAIANAIKIYDEEK